MNPIPHEDQTPEQRKLLKEMSERQDGRAVRIRGQIHASYSSNPPYAKEELEKAGRDWREKLIQSASMKKIIEATISIDRPESDDIHVRITGTVTAPEYGARDSMGAQLEPDLPAEAEVISAVIAQDVPALDEDSAVIPGRYSFRKGQALDLTEQEQDKAQTALFEAVE